MARKISVLWLVLLPLCVGAQTFADQRPGKHHHDDKAPHGMTKEDHEHTKDHHHHHQHAFWETPPAAYASLSSTRWDDAAAIARGQQLFQSYCMVCHGSDGKGTGPAAKGLEHPPADLTNHFHRAPGDGDAYLFWRVSEGGEVEPFKSMKSAMPAFKTVLTEDQRWDVLAYVHAQFHRGFKPNAVAHIVIGEGKVLVVVHASAQLVVEHGEIQGFMDAMTMGYQVNPPSLLDGLKAGDTIRFTIDIRQKAIIQIAKRQP